MTIFVILHDVHNILFRHCLDEPTVFTKGESLVLHNEINRVLAVQWLDNKLVSCMSTLGETGLIPVQQRKGDELLQLSVEITLKRYQDGMGGVNC